MSGEANNRASAHLPVRGVKLDYLRRYQACGKLCFKRPNWGDREGVQDRRAGDKQGALGEVPPGADPAIIAL